MPRCTYTYTYPHDAFLRRRLGLSRRVRVQALGGRVVPVRSANVVILADGAAQPRLAASKASAGGGGAGQQQPAKVYVLAQGWLYELAETHRMPDARLHLA